ncbi:uncharacterized protein N7498_004626 [Penicillium cinerascens]|uniref:Uncharacterized protein n=1 Tax=Penicillium cinerascens TaxID=70096 RepID=A0A9W9SZG9_9EURO|nr:uncharacterized protein N7498_004626 [Penicillium cinerascens]KAJ5203747.1 hypothetical protein N7498_004626 [Penicillium cinerascens]
MNDKAQLRGLFAATGYTAKIGFKAGVPSYSKPETTLAELDAGKYPGMTASGYPYMFHIYGTHGPTLLSNGPTTMELQGRWVGDFIQRSKGRASNASIPSPLQPRLGNTVS